MTEQRTYPHGVPCWIDTEQPDQTEASRFYGSLFSWTFEEAMPPGAPGSYLIAKLDGFDVAAIGAAPGSSATWSTYIAVDDADDMVARVTEAGGRVVSPPQDAGPGGRAATFTDENDVEFRVWQARRRPGAQVVNAPNSWNFSDLHTTEVEAARAFYGQVFGWEADDLDLGNDQSAVMWRRPGYGDHLAATIDPHILRRQADVGAPTGFADAIAWLAPVAEHEVPNWHVTFAVVDRDEAVATAISLGAVDLHGPIDTMWMKAAVVRDPQGATFTLSQFTPPET